MQSSTCRFLVPSSWFLVRSVLVLFWFTSGSVPGSGSVACSFSEQEQNLNRTNQEPRTRNQEPISYCTRYFRTCGPSRRVQARGSRRHMSDKRETVAVGSAETRARSRSGIVYQYSGRSSAPHCRLNL